MICISHRYSRARTAAGAGTKLEKITDAIPIVRNIVDSDSSCTPSYIFFSKMLLLTKSLIYCGKKCLIHSYTIVLIGFEFYGFFFSPNQFLCKRTTKLKLVVVTCLREFPNKYAVKYLQHDMSRSCVTLGQGHESCQINITPSTVRSPIKIAASLLKSGQSQVNDKPGLRVPIGQHPALRQVKVHTL